MVKQKELPGTPKMDKSAELAIEVLEIKKDIKDKRESLTDAAERLAASLMQQDRESIRVTFEGESYTIEVQHIDEEKIKVKKS